MEYGKHFSTQQTPQSEPIPGTAQVANNAGGFGWAVDDWVRLDRFLILGAEGGTYYVSEKKLTKENALSVLNCIKADGLRTVARITEISQGGRAPKNDAAIFALAMAASLGDAATKKAARNAIPEVCRIGTHLFHFVRDVQAFGGWGRGLRKAIGKWYSREIKDVSYQAIKYPQRDGWTHADLLRLAHVKPASPDHDALFQWIKGSEPPEGRKAKYKVQRGPLPRLVTAMNELRASSSANEIAKLIRDHDLPREAVESADTKWLKEKVVWEALLERMPMTAMVRSLARMTASGLLAPMSTAVKHVVNELANADRIHKSRLHPIALLFAQKVYAQGHGEKGSLTWTPVPQIIDALDAAFYLAFENSPSTGKRYVLALDVSGSMETSKIAGIPSLAARDVAAALALVTASREPNYAIMAFSSTFMPLAISPRQRLSDVLAMTDDMDFGGTDCSLPMTWAMKNKIPADAFVVLTDSETWQGSIHPSQALVKYRQAMGINAKSVVVGMTSNGFTIADPKDAGMLDVVGCDTVTPNIIADFCG